MILVSDASALITLSRIEQLDLLQKLAGSVHIPDAVYREAVSVSPHLPGAGSVAQASWIIRHQVKNRQAVENLRAVLGYGESEAIILAEEGNAALLILDDATARRIAEDRGCRVIGLLGLLIHAKERRILPVIRPILERIVSAGFYIDDKLYRFVLRAADED